VATHDIPRNIKGEGRILYIFSTKGLIFTAIGLFVGWIFYWIFSTVLGLFWIGIGIALLFALIGFLIATFKIPDSTTFEVTRKLGGENIDEVILRAIKFYQKKKRIYVYTNVKEEEK
jgi:hypothetical protein